MILVTGADGQLGTAFRRRLGDEAHYLTIEDLDLFDTSKISGVIASFNPRLVINCAAYTAVDRAEDDEEAARVVNATAVGELAAATATAGSTLVTFSTDYVFDGTKDGPYTEDDRPSPINAYGRTKLEGERAAVGANPQALVIRTSWLMSGTHPNFASTMLRLIGEGEVRVVDDQYGHPTFVDDLAEGTLAAADAGASGVLHLANAGTTTWYGLAREIAAVAGLDVDRVQPTTTGAFPRPAPRPANSVLDSARLEELGLEPLPHYAEALQAAVTQLGSRS